MLTFDPTTTSGVALAGLFRTWCRLRGDDTEGEVSRGDMMSALGATFQNLGLVVGGPATQLDVPADHQVFTVIGLSCDHSDTLYVAHVIPGEYADAGAELATSEDHFGQWAATFTAPSADAAADMARRQVEDGALDGHTVVPTEPEEALREPSPAGSCATPSPSPAPNADPTLKWQRLAAALNELDNDGFALLFGDRMGAETNWYPAPYVYSGNRPDAPRTAWDRKKKKWVVEKR
ncbi:hypothetical protein [Streptomyces sp. MZ04]|uniref:hypothetical protein n=1 Tax=Streptomyces sp. MZ04 TaxID=2559236 RepID=UPI001AE0CDE2|nr:hypothetical protein [Streptomyces sp. MZ04]